MPAPRPIHEQFADEYQERGLQPHYKTQVNYRDAEGADSIPNQETSYQDEVTSRPGPLRQTAQVAYHNRPRTKRKSPTKGAKVNATRKGLAYSRVTVTNVSILSWGMTLWVLQFQLALLSLFAIGGMGFYERMRENDVGEVLLIGFEGLYRSVAHALSSLNLVNLPSPEDLKGLMVSTILLPAAVGMITLLIASIQYVVLRVRPLFGEGSDLKMATFLVAMIGYFIPIMNMLPWFVFWVLVVWRYPK